MATCFLEAWGTKANKKPHILKKRIFVPCRRRREEPKHHYFLENVCLFGLGAPSLPKSTWLKNNFGIPLKYTMGIRPERTSSGRRYATATPDPILDFLRSYYLPSFRIANQNYNLNFGNWPICGRTWPRDPFQRVRLEIWCRTQPKLAPDANSKTIS